MKIDLDPALAAHVKVALKAHIRQLVYDRVEPPAALAALVDQLEREPLRLRLAAERKRRLRAARNRRYRQRKAAVMG